MLRFLADENFDGRVLRGLLRQLPNLDILTVQQIGLQSRPDPEVLQRAADEGRILLSHDRATMPRFAMDRVSRRMRMPGLILVRFDQPMGAILDDLLIIVGAGRPEEFEDQAIYLPLP